MNKIYTHLYVKAYVPLHFVLLYLCQLFFVLFCEKCIIWGGWWVGGVELFPVIHWVDFY